MKKFFHKTILTPILDLLKQGLTPDKLAMSLSAGVVISCFPVLGTTTVLCALIAHFLKLNHVAIQLANYVCYPLQFLMLIPFFIIGNKIFGYDQMVLSIDEMLVHFQIDPVGFFETYIGLALRACVAWLICAPIAFVIMYYPLRLLMFKISKKSIASIVLLLIFSPQVYSETFLFQGTARNSKNEIAYTEKHTVTLEKGKVIKSETLYFDSKGEKIAELKSDYKESIFLPSYTFKDFRFGIEHIVSRESEGLMLKHREDQKSEFKSKLISAKSDMVSCQGFHYFIRDHLSEFQKNESRDIHLILPGLLDYFSFNIQTQDKKDLEGDIIKLKMTVNSWVLKIFVSTVQIEYDKPNKRLLKYIGASNILTDKKQTQDVVITYQY